MKEVYILLTRSETVVSRAIRNSTGAAYTHASLAYDKGLTSLSSFARHDPRFPLPAGLIREDLRGGYYALHDDIPCLLLSVPVTEDGLELIVDRVEEMQERRRKYGYSILGLLACRIGWVWERQRKYFCSQFVAELLQCGGVELQKAPSLMHPCDFLELQGTHQLYKGSVGDLSQLYGPIPIV